MVAVKLAGNAPALGRLVVPLDGTIVARRRAGFPTRIAPFEETDTLRAGAPRERTTHPKLTARQWGKPFLPFSTGSTARRCGMAAECDVGRADERRPGGSRGGARGDETGENVAGAADREDPAPAWEEAVRGGTADSTKIPRHATQDHSAVIPSRSD
jgi:hypothetical protein